MFIRNVQVLPGDSLMVFDGQLKRVTVLSEAPEARRSAPRATVRLDALRGGDPL